jgi:hypothetical protein
MTEKNLDRLGLCHQPSYIGRDAPYMLAPSGADCSRQVLERAIAYTVLRLLEGSGVGGSDPRSVRVWLTRSGKFEDLPKGLTMARRSLERHIRAPLRTGHTVAVEMKGRGFH